MTYTCGHKKKPTLEEGIKAIAEQSGLSEEKVREVLGDKDAK